MPVPRYGQYGVVPGSGQLPEVPQAPRSRRTTVLAASVLATSLLCAVAVSIPVPYAVESPGPTVNTLGEQGGKKLITIEGAETYDGTGELRLTTVSATGSKGYPTSLSSAIRGWFSQSSVVEPAEQVFDLSQTAEQSQLAGQQEMTTSQEDATVAALTELGYEVPATMTVIDTVKDSGSDGVLLPDDVLTAIDGTTLRTYGQLISTLDGTKPGTTLTLTVQRAGKATDVDVVTSPRPDPGDNGSVLGVYIKPDFDMPVKVTISIDDIGGPSAGTMFALGIIDNLTPQDEANGHVIAGTGTIDVDGTVGPIGGIRQKLAGAKRDGAEWFLAPASNCDEVVGYIPRGLHVTKISTLAEARAAVEAIGAGDTDSLPTCS